MFARLTPCLSVASNALTPAERATRTIVKRPGPTKYNGSKAAAERHRSRVGKATMAELSCQPVPLPSALPYLLRNDNLYWLASTARTMRREQGRDGRGMYQNSSMLVINRVVSKGQRIT